MATEHQPQPRVGGTNWLTLAAIAGLIAGIIMGAFTMLASALVDEGFWAPMRTIASFFFGEDLAGETFDLGPVMTGMAIHLMLSIVFGVLYGFVLGAFTNRLPHAGKVVAGVIFAVALWALNTFLIAPVLPGGGLIEDNLEITTIPSWAWAAGHLLYGIALGQLYAGERGRETKLMP